MLSTQVVADTDSSLKDMMSTAATRAGGSLTFTSAASISKGDVGGFNRTAVDLGGVRFRAPVESFNLVSFTKPNVSAGCSGVDLTLGSFSFLSKDELIAMFRSIASNALTYAFGQAIKGMCENCWTMMNTLQQKMQDMNQMFSNTCSAAMCINEEGCRTEMIGDTACLFTAGWTKDNDYSGCKDEAKKAGGIAEIAARTKANETGTEGAGFIMGNMSYEMIDRGTVDIDVKLNAFSSLMGLTISPKEFLISILGTVIIDENGDAGAPLLATLNFSDIFNNAGDEANPGDLTTRALTCTENADFNGVTYECFKMDSQDLSRSVVKVDKFITDKMMNIVSSLNDFSDATLVALSPMEKYLLNFIEPHLINAIVLGTDQDGLDAAELIKQKAPYIAAQLKSDFSTTIINLLKNIIIKGHQNNDTRSAVVMLNDRLLDLQVQRRALLKDSEDKLKYIAKTNVWIKLKTAYSSSLADKIVDLMDKE